MIDLSQFNNASFDRGAPRWKEALWLLARTVLFLHPVPLPSAMKVATLRFFGATIGEGAVIRSRVNISFPWKVTLGDHIWIGEDVTILSLDQVTIGSHVCISQRAFLCTGSHDFGSSQFDLMTRPITVEDHCWIAATAFLGPGVSIGKGSLVAAGAVVVNDVSPGSKIGGNPARPLR